MQNTTEQMILDFTSTGTSLAWEAIDDRIMGGCSQSQPEYINATGLHFSGVVSLDNNGGFASIRSAEDDFNLAGHSGLMLRVRGDGKTYKLSLRTDHFYDGVSYQVSFTTQAGTWQELRLPFADFTPTHHGVILTTVAPLDPARVKSFGLFIADRQAGPFELDLAWIKGY